MVNQQVTKKNTPITEAQISRALMDAARELFGVQLTKPQLALLVAQNNLETGNRKYMWNWNVGNITHVAGDGFDYWSGLDWLYDAMPDASGITREQKKTIKLQYRAYPDLETGAKDYLKLLKGKANGAIWKKILEADPAGFSKELKKNRYYTAHEEDYTKGIVGQVNAYNKRTSYEDAVSGKTDTPSKDSTGLLGKIDQLLNHFLKAVAEMQQTNLRK